MTTALSQPIESVDDVDLSDLDFWARPLPERDRAFALLRRDRPLAFYAEPDPPQDWIPVGPGYYAVTRYADIEHVSRHPQIFSSAQGATSINDMPPEFLEFFGSMINLDAPRHLRLRKIVSRAFSPRVVQRVEDDIAVVAAAIVDDIAPRGSCDFVPDVAARLPLKVICNLMGIPEEEYDRVFRCSNVILGAGDPEYVPEGADIVAALLGAGGELSELVQGLSRSRRERPTDDLISALANAEVDGERLTDVEIASFFILLAVAGNETTRNAIAYGLQLLTENPDQRLIWQDDVEGVTPTAVDEIVRWASPVTWMRRTVTRDTELRGQQLKAGDKLLLFYNSGNRDEDPFTDPYAFDVRRSPNPHLGFGGTGPHFCLGAHLARTEIGVIFRELFRRLPDLHAVGEPQRLRSSFINGIKHLLCEFTPLR